jgi:hypothetical protein
VRHPGGWAVRGEGNMKATKVTRTQQEAIDAAIEIAKNQGTDVIVRNREGLIRLREQSANLKKLFEAWDADPDDKPDEWWEDIGGVPQYGWRPD